MGAKTTLDVLKFCGASVVQQERALPCILGGTVVFLYYAKVVKGQHGFSFGAPARLPQGRTLRSYFMFHSKQEQVTSNLVKNYLEQITSYKVLKANNLNNVIPANPEFGKCLYPHMLCGMLSEPNLLMNSRIRAERTCAVYTAELDICVGDFARGLVSFLKTRDGFSFIRFVVSTL